MRSQLHLTELPINSTTTLTIYSIISKKLGLVNQKEDVIFLIEKFEVYSTLLGTARKKPLFYHKLWNIHDRVIAAVPRSNNSVEGWHNAFANRVSISHPNIVKLSEKIRREQSKFEVDMAKILQGHIIKTKKACYRRLDERITRLVNAVDSSQLDEFLKKMAANIIL
ncbi:unnamed protein product [Rotaria magnacalcarata]|uniref:Uncharacterized protein n=1 Tax=Rotaria magnacalcarata TaxID=392030 RepID=A0A816QJV2_9BILA|nr:unnamed protein product [Rotaria magnacalcarata]